MSRPTSDNGLGQRLSTLSIKTTPIRILSLPGEIVDLIISYVEPRDLANLRLTSRELCALATKHFGNYHFSNCYFTFTQPSLRSFSQLARHPDFSEYIESINFGTHRVPDCDEAILDMGVSNLWRLIRSVLNLSLDGETIDWVYTLRLYEQYAKEQQEFLEDGMAQYYLSLGFNSLATVIKGRKITIGIYDNAGLSTGYGSDPFHDELELNLWTYNFAQTFKILGETIGASDFELRSLKLDIKRNMRKEWGAKEGLECLRKHLVD